MLYIIILFLLGASVGSFLSVVIHRIQKNKKGILFGQSECPNCKKQLQTIDLIPIVSYLMQQGKCRHCKKKISPDYLYLELLTAVAFAVLFTKYPFLEFGRDFAVNFSIEDLQFYIFGAIYSTFWIGILFYDLQTRQIPDVFLFPLLAIAALDLLIFRTGMLTSGAIAFVIAGIFFGGQIFVSNGKWLGSGDLYLSLSMALIFGTQLLVVAVVLSYIIGAAISIPLLASKNVKLKSQIAFGPFLVIGSFITMYFGEDLLQWYTATLTM